MTAPVLRPRWARVVGAVWLTAAVALVVAGLVVVVDQHAVAWELPAGVVAAVLGWWLYHRHLAVDEHGIEQCVGWRRTRLLWGVVDGIDVPEAGGLPAPVQVRLTGRGTVALQASLGLSRTQRDELLARLAAAGHAAG